jgi:hypothetical protein
MTKDGYATPTGAALSLINESVLAALIDAAVERRLRAGRLLARSYSQHDRPAWAPTALVFLRAWRDLRSEGHPGVTAVGKTRVMTEDASDEWCGRATKRRSRQTCPVVRLATHVDDGVLAELGARRRAGGAT